MVSSGMLHRVTLVRTDVSVEIIASFIMVTGICELGTTLAVTSNRRTLFTDSCHPDEGGAKFLRNVSSYKSHMPYHPRRHHSLVYSDFTNKTGQQPIFVSDTQVPYANTAKYLGMILDAMLRWKELIKNNY
jgi:hypothetical protein